MSTSPVNVVNFVQHLLESAAARNASDIHLDPEPDGFVIRLRVDGLLEPAQRVDLALGRAAVTRLMVLAQLLTYRLDIPQEGKAAVALPGSSSESVRAMRELRISVIPSVNGMRCAVRLPSDDSAPRDLDMLGLPASVLAGLYRFAAADAGMIMIVGPAGSGKTTTIYAVLRHIQKTQPQLSIISLEDPVERLLPGVVQIEVRPHGELTFERALPSVLRQDPQVLALGEVRDAATASLAVQATLSGHRLVCTMHASTPGSAIARLIEMGIEPYRIAGSVRGVLNQRLVRKWRGSDFSGRTPVAEFSEMTPALREAVLRRADAATLDELFLSMPGRFSIREHAAELVQTRTTTQAEIGRVLGSESKNSASAEPL